MSIEVGQSLETTKHDKDVHYDYECQCCGILFHFKFLCTGLRVLFVALVVVWYFEDIKESVRSS